MFRTPNAVDIVWNIAILLLFLWFVHTSLLLFLWFVHTSINY